MGEERGAGGGVKGELEGGGEGGAGVSVGRRA